MRQHSQAPIGCLEAEITVTPLEGWNWIARCRDVEYMCAGLEHTMCSPRVPPLGPTVRTMEDEEVASSGGEESVTAIDVRAALDAQRDVIAACVGTLPIGVVIRVAPGGVITTDLTGIHAGTDEARCVQHALRGLAVARLPPSEERIVHVIR